MEVEYPVDAAKVLLTVSTTVGMREAAATVEGGEDKVEMDLSGLPCGIHVLSLFIDGVLADNTRIIKE